MKTDALPDEPALIEGRKPDAHRSASRAQNGLPHDGRKNIGAVEREKPLDGTGTHTEPAAVRLFNAHDPLNRAETGEAALKARSVTAGQRVTSADSPERQRPPRPRSGRSVPGGIELFAHGTVRDTDPEPDGKAAAPPGRGTTARTRLGIHRRVKRQETGCRDVRGRKTFPLGRHVRRHDQNGRHENCGKIPSEERHPGRKLTEMKPIDVERLIGVLDRVTRRGPSIMARCPAHEDRIPSLHITITEVAVLWKCHAGCGQNDVLEALISLGGLPETDAASPPHRPNGKQRRRLPAAEGTDAELPAKIWDAARPINGSPGRRYLRRRIGSAADENPDIRWLPVKNARSVLCSPKLPPSVAGALVYRFRRHAEGEDDPAGACQLEAVDADARRVRFPKQNMVSRLSVYGSYFSLGERVFRAAVGIPPDGGCWICEGPLDAMALTALGRRGDIDLANGAVVGTAGAGLASPNSAAGEPGLIRLAVDNDEAGELAAERFTEVAGAPDDRGWRRAAPPEEHNDWTELLTMRLGLPGLC